MKKMIFALAAMATLVGCSSDEVLDLHQDPIGFTDVFVDNSTRAIDNTYNSSDNKPSSFYVYGTTQDDKANSALVSIFKHIEVNSTDNGSTYSYDSDYTQYWIKDNKYKFAALVHADQNNVKLGVDKLPKSLTFTSDSQTDLLYASTDEIIGKDSGNETVGFVFNHLLSKVHVTFKNTITTNSDEVKYQYCVSDVFIDNAIQTAVCDLSSKEWTDHQSNLKVEFGHISGAEDNDDFHEAVIIEGKTAHTSNNARLLIPGKYIKENGINELTLIFTIETLINGVVVDKNTEKLPVNVELKAGTAYNFIIEKGAPGDKIEFTVNEVNEWDAPTDVPQQGNN